MCTNKTNCCQTNIITCQKKACNCNISDSCHIQDKYTKLKSLSIDSLMGCDKKTNYEDALITAKVIRNAFFSAKASIYNFICDIEEISINIKSDISDNKYNLQSVKNQYISLLNILISSIYTSLNQCYKHKKLININMVKISNEVKNYSLRSTNLLFTHPVSCKKNIISYIPSVSLQLNVITEELKIKFCEPEYINVYVKHGTPIKNNDLCKMFILGPAIQSSENMDISDNNLELLKAFGCSTLDLEEIDTIDDVFDDPKTAQDFFNSIINYQNDTKCNKIKNNLLSIMNYLDKVINSMENSHRFIMQTRNINEDC